MNSEGIKRKGVREMKSNLRFVSLLVVMGICGFSTVISAQKTTNNQASPKTGAKSSSPKKTKNPATGETVGPKVKNQRPPSTGSSSGNDRPASSGEVLTDPVRTMRVLKLLIENKMALQPMLDNSAGHLLRAKNLLDDATTQAFRFKGIYFEVQNIQTPDDDSYVTPRGDTVNEIKGNLEQALRYLNLIQYETPSEHRALTIGNLNGALAQLNSYFQNPPTDAEKAEHIRQRSGFTKNNPTGAAPKQGGTAKSSKSGKQMVTPNEVDTTLKTAPAGTTRKPTKTTGKKPKNNE